MARVFLAGASGAIGRPLLRELLAAGHSVTGMTRREQAARQIEAAGAAAVVCDVFDRERLERVLAESSPEIVVHELTALPKALDVTEKGVFDANNRIRREGTRNLIAAARAAGARRLLAESICFIYEPRGEWVKSEEAPLHAGEETGAAAAELERQVLEAEGLEGVVLRYGFFYGPGTGYAADSHQAEQVRRRRFAVIGAGTGTFSFVQVEDAARATLAALERAKPGVFNVCDDEPAPLREWLPVYAQAVGAKPPRRVPRWVARLVAGPQAVAWALDLRGASNAKAKRELGWEPRYPSWRRGFFEGLG